MLHLKYVLETSVKEDEEGNTKSVAYLPIKIGEFVTDSQNNTMQFNKSYVLMEDSSAVLEDKDQLMNLQGFEPKEKKPLALNLGLLDPQKPVSLCGLKRKNSKPTEELEDEIRKLKKRVDGLEKELQNALHHKTSFHDLEDEEEFGLSDHDSSSFLNDSLNIRTKSGKLSVGTDIAYLYSVPLVREHNSKILSMGLPIDHNAEIDEIIKVLNNTNKAVGFRMEAATIDSLQNLLMIKPKVVHLSCHGEFDRVEDTYYLAFESKKVTGMMEKLSMSRLKTLFSTQTQLKSIECLIVSACHSQKIGEMMKDSGVPVVICINAPFKIQDEAAR